MVDGPAEWCSEQDLGRIPTQETMLLWKNEVRFEMVEDPKIAEDPCGIRAELNTRTHKCKFRAAFQNRVSNTLSA